MTSHCMDGISGASPSAEAALCSRQPVVCTCLLKSLKKKAGQQLARHAREPDWTVVFSLKCIGPLLLHVALISACPHAS
eukprot:4099699-Pyramimonas_sp.AAC.1